jgi:hypothetical protein
MENFRNAHPAPTVPRRIEQPEVKRPIVESLELLSKDMLLLREIYAFKKTHGRWPIPREMVESFSSRGLGDKYTVSRAEDMLTDMGLLDTEWVKLEDGRNANGFAICKHAMDFAKVVFENTEGIPVR